ncbi:hypothetical protein GGR56DRAFT_475876 [Xylariaceae sp. FL0804]|nr:hypothetical protein GGR56DRAFT_475876 [Xylariaceae sp. FL0804]
MVDQLSVSYRVSLPHGPSNPATPGGGRSRTSQRVRESAHAARAPGRGRRNRDGAPHARQAGRQAGTQGSRSGRGGGAGGIAQACRLPHQRAAAAARHGPGRAAGRWCCSCSSPTASLVYPSRLPRPSIPNQARADRTTIPLHQVGGEGKDLCMPAAPSPVLPNERLCGNGALPRPRSRLVSFSSSNLPAVYGIILQKHRRYQVYIGPLVDVW